MDMRIIVLGSGLGDYRRSVQTLVGNKVEEAVPHAQPMGATDLLCQQQHHSLST
jgi:hypothetical protein